MKKIVAFGASSSKKSINKQFASYAASLISDSDSIIIDLNYYYMIHMYRLILASYLLYVYFLTMF